MPSRPGMAGRSTGSTSRTSPLRTFQSTGVTPADTITARSAGEESGGMAMGRESSRCRSTPGAADPADPPLPDDGLGVTGAGPVGCIAPARCTTPRGSGRTTGGCSHAHQLSPCPLAERETGRLHCAPSPLRLVAAVLSEVVGHRSISTCANSRQYEMYSHPQLNSRRVGPTVCANAFGSASGSELCPVVGRIGHQEQRLPVNSGRGKHPDRAFSPAAPPERCAAERRPSPTHRPDPVRGS